MGTNYYHRTNVCEHCGRGDDDVHIGKSSGGWTFSFHGTAEIRSWEDWLKVLRGGGEIFDEYERRVTLRDFIKLVDDKRTAELNHTIEMRNSPDGRYFDEWLDDCGHSFSGHEFS